MNAPHTAPTIQDPRPQYFDDPNLDRLMAVLITMANELWVTKDRLMILERLLAKRGSVTPEEVDHYQPNEEEKKELEAARKAYIARVLSGLTIDPRPVEEIRQMKGIKPLT
ncbi:MAG: hypothetical protein RMM58_07075 [Chloroflexota bacterium]|nr:hypothetical protein [Dehalococcoidia bacterium]MDW8253622.1 hypothetical protein [Chloroflexota bacterium]